MLMHCKQLEQLLSINNSTWSYMASIESQGEVQPVSKGRIIEFVLQTLTTRWLRSDLTMEHVAMLQQERPHMAFVTN